MIDPRPNQRVASVGSMAGSRKKAKFSSFVAAISDEDDIRRLIPRRRLFFDDYIPRRRRFFQDVLICSRGRCCRIPVPERQLGSPNNCKFVAIASLLPRKDKLKLSLSQQRHNNYGRSSSFFAAVPIIIFLLPARIFRGSAMLRPPQKCWRCLPPFCDDCQWYF